MSRWVLVASILLLGGCGSGTEVSLPRTLTGTQVGVMAERQLEAQHVRMRPGTMTCPDLELRKGASVRCVRRTELTGGRVVRIGGTVEVTSTREGGRLHVRLDTDPIDYGLTSAAVAAEVARRTNLEATSLRCSALPGRIGALGRCRIVGTTKVVRLRVTKVDGRECWTHFDVLPARVS